VSPVGQDPARALRKLLLVSLGADGPERPSHQEVCELLRSAARAWELADCVLAAPERAGAAAEALGCAVELEPDLAEPPDPSRAPRVVERLRRRGVTGAVVVAPAASFDAIWRALLAGPGPGPKTPPGMLGLLTRVPCGWLPGRRSSDPPPLRSRLEREGIDAAENLLSPGLRHWNPLQIRCGRG
jgi:hypothetical protein